MKSFDEMYQPYVDFVYTCVDRIQLRGYVSLLQQCGGFRTWAERMRPEEPVTQAWIQSLTRRFHETVKKSAEERGIEVREITGRDRKRKRKHEQHTRRYSWPLPSCLLARATTRPQLRT